MDFFKLASFRSLLCICVLVVFLQETSCASFTRRTSPPKRSCPALKQQLTDGTINMRKNNRIARYRCNKGFKIFGEGTATCLRGRWEGTAPLCVKPGCLKVYAPKNGQLMEFIPSAVLVFHCNHGYALNGSRTIYCNGIKWNGTVPTCQVDTSEPETSCDFESEDICGWTQDGQHNFDWRRHHYATPSGHLVTGPSFDHTKGRGLDGYYMYIESSSPRMINDTARLYSPIYSARHSVDACFVFWYHMYGQTTGSLQIYQKPEDANLSSLVPLLSMTGERGNQWFRGLVRLNETKTPFQIVVEGVRGSSYTSDSAFDDVQLTNGTDCLLDTSESAPTRIDTGWGGDVLNDAQSCRSRCTNNPFLPSSPPTNDSDMETPLILTCECHLGCLDTGTCCPDYSSYCITAKVTPPSLPVPATLEYRTIASVHYFPLSSPRPTLPLPPPLPPLPPKPTVVTSQEPPKPTQSKILFETTGVVETTRLDDSSVVPTTQSYTETVPTNLKTNVDETSPGTTDLREDQFVTTVMNNSKLPETEVTTPETTYLPQYLTDAYTLSVITTSVDSNKDDQFLQTTIVPVEPTFTTSTAQTLNLTTKTTEAQTSTKIMNTIQNNSLVSQINTQRPTTLIKMPVKQVTSVERSESTTTKTVTKDRRTTNPTEIIVPEKASTPRRTFFYPVKKPYVPKSTEHPTTTTTIRKRTTTRNRMMYYPNQEGDDAETSYLLKKELINPQKGSSVIPWPETQQATKGSTTTNASMVIGIVGGIALLLVAFGVVAFAVVRRRRLAGGRNNMSDDSDVRFLTADEVLDFNIARPSEEDDRC